MKSSNNNGSNKRKNRFQYQALEPKQMLSANLPSVDAQIELTRDYLSNNAETAYLLQSESDLKFIEVKYGLASTTTRFQQMVDGIPIHSAIVTINQGANDEFQRVHHDLAFDTSFVDFPEPQDFPFNVKAAEQAAMTKAGVSETYVPTRVEGAWYVDAAGEISQVWEMTVFSARQPVGDFLTIVDTFSNEVLMQENRAAFFELGTGDVFEPNPWQTQGNGTGLADNNDADSAALDGQLITVTLEGLDEGTGYLTGEFVDLATLNSPDLPDDDADEASRIYSYTRDDARFEQVLIYHSVDQINRYFHQLGFDDDSGATPNGIRDFPTLANAHWFDDDQSFYSSADDAIHFGDGGVDDGEDADIVAHEYGHAIQHNQNAAWGGGEMGAMGEGFGDYLAAAFYKDFGDSAFQALHAAAVGEWDATSYSSDNPPNLRRVDGNKMYPTDLVGQVHADGEIWSRALWDLNANVGAQYADQLILEQHFMLAAGATMPTAANTILLANQNINGGDNLAQVRHPFVTRGILSPSTAANFDADVYQEGDNLVFYVSDLNAINPIEATISSSDGDFETVTLVDTGNGLLRGVIPTSNSGITTEDGMISVINASTDVTLTYTGGGFASDTATIEAEVTTIEGTSGDDIIHVVIDDILTITVNGVDNYIDTAVQASLIFNAKTGFDQITIVDSYANDYVTIRDETVTVSGFYNFTAQSVESVHTTSGGGDDWAKLFGTPRDEVFESFNGSSVLTGDGFEYGAHGYGDVFAFAIEGSDRATFGDSPGNDRFYATPMFANMTTDTAFINARDFDVVNVHSTNGGNDIASLTGSKESDSLYANSNLARLQGVGVDMTAVGFDRTWVNGGNGNDSAFLAGTDGDDSFNSRPYSSYLYSTGYFNQAVNFEKVTGDAGANGNDRAIMLDSPGADVFYATPTMSALTSAQFRSQANGFDVVSAIGSAGLDRAILVDSDGNDRFISRPDSAYLIGDSFLNYVREFDQVTARSNGGVDLAILNGSQEDDRLYASQPRTYLQGLNYYNAAENFRRVTINNAGSPGFNIATFQDSNGNDSFVGNGSQATLFNDDYFVVSNGLDRVTAISSNGGFDTLSAGNVDYQFLSFGDWN